MDQQSTTTFFTPQVLSAIITFTSVIIGIFIKDIILALYFNNKNKAEKDIEKSILIERERREIVRVYADPLYMAAKSLNSRLTEITNPHLGKHLLSSAPKTEYNEYKKISNLYRLAALLGWIRAFRRERSYLDPYDGQTSEVDEAIGKVESALADGQVVEEVRLSELAKLWNIDIERHDKNKLKSLASEIDVAKQDFMIKTGEFNNNKIDEDRKIEIVSICSKLFLERLGKNASAVWINSRIDEACELLAIRESYIYRDWQSAIGDFMITQITGNDRKFDIIGFGEFERRYISAQKEDNDDKRWFNRIESIFHDLDMSTENMFDARREQIIRLNESCSNLSEKLKEKIQALSKEKGFIQSR